MRNDVVLTPTGDTIIEARDKVVMCLLHDAIHEIEAFISDDSELINI